MAKIAEVTFTSADRVRDMIRNFNTDGFASLFPDGPSWNHDTPPDPRINWITSLIAAMGSIVYDKRLIERIRESQDGFGLDGRYYTTAMLLNGMNLAMSGGLLRGFEEWLCVQKRELSSFIWFKEIFREAVPEVRPGEWREPLEPEQEQRAVDHLFTRVLDFLEVRDSREDLARMYAAYQQMKRSY